MNLKEHVAKKETITNIETDETRLLKLQKVKSKKKILQEIR